MIEQWSLSVGTCVLSVPLRRLFGGVCDRVDGLPGEQGGRGGGGHGDGEDCGCVQLTLQVLRTIVTRLLITSDTMPAELKSQVSPSMIHCWWWHAIPVTSAMLRLVFHMVALVATCTMCWPPSSVWKQKSTVRAGVAAVLSFSMMLQS